MKEWLDQMLDQVQEVAKALGKDPVDVAYQFQNYDRLIESDAYHQAVVDIVEDEWDMFRDNPDDFKAGDIWILADVNQVHDEIAERLCEEIENA